MKKVLVLVFMGLAVCVGYAQLRVPGIWPYDRLSSERIRFDIENPTGTNKFGRTYAVQCDYEQFMKRNPDGKDKFGKTFEEQSSYDIKSFLGFKFGEQCYKYDLDNTNLTENVRVSFVKAWLAKPFRMFESASLCGSKKGRLCEVSLSERTEDVTFGSLTNEVLKLAALLEKQYQIPLYDCAPRPYCSGSPYCSRFFCRAFQNDNVFVDISCSWDSSGGRGSIKVEIRNKVIEHCDATMCEEEKKRKDEERQNRILEKQKNMDIPDDDGLELLNAKEPKIVKAPERVGGGKLSQKQRREQESGTNTVMKSSGQKFCSLRCYREHCREQNHAMKIEDERRKAREQRRALLEAQVEREAEMRKQRTAEEEKYRMEERKLEPK